MAISSKIHSKERVESLVKYAETAIKSIQEKSALALDTVSATFEMPNKTIIRLSMALDLDDDKLSRNESLLREKINKVAKKQVVNQLIHMNLIFATVEIVDAVTYVLYHDARLNIQEFVEITKFLALLK